MSTSVYKHENMNFCNKLSYGRNPVMKVKRLLFGPIDPEETISFIQNELSADFNRTCRKWNFDFREETTLDPDGDYIWESPSPVVINRKRKSLEVLDGSSAYYFVPIEPAARSAETQSQSQLKPKISKQSQITDYMTKSKRQVVYPKDTTSVERPKKIPKLTDCSSS